MRTIWVAVVVQLGLLSLLGACSPQTIGDDPASSAAISKRKKHDMAMAEDRDAGTNQESADAALPLPIPGPNILTSFYTPSAAGQQPVIEQIMSAGTSIHMMMFHLTQMPVVQALVAAAGQGVDVRLIVDQGNWASHTASDVKDALSNAGISVTPSSTAFSITHTKSFLIDGNKTVIMTLNLTSPYATTRDYAVVTDDAGIAAEFESVFQADLQNAADDTMNTPTLSDEFLLWSPVNSESKLVSFIDGAQKTLMATAENLGDAKVQAALLAAAGRGVAVRLIAPLCDQNVNPLFDYPSLAALNAGGVAARAMPTPSTGSEPYMHAKLLIADNDHAYIGSMNFSTQSLTTAREVGVFFSDAPTIASFASLFEQDWAVAITPPAEKTIVCPAVTD